LGTLAVSRFVFSDAGAMTAAAAEKLVRHRKCFPGAVDN
jgi:hypothetical protein